MLPSFWEYLQFKDLKIVLWLWVRFLAWASIMTMTNHFGVNSRVPVVLTVDPYQSVSILIHRGLSYYVVLVAIKLATVTLYLSINIKHPSIISGLHHITSPSFMAKSWPCAKEHLEALDFSVLWNHPGTVSLQRFPPRCVFRLRRWKESGWAALGASEGRWSAGNGTSEERPAFNGKPCSKWGFSGHVWVG